MSIDKDPQPNQEKPKGEGSLMGSIAMLAGVLLLLFCVLSIINTAFGLKLEVYDTPLPRYWDATLGLCGVAAIWWGFYAILTFIPPIRRFGQRSPWITTGIILAIIVGAIVIITIIDNKNRAERRKYWDEVERREQDSLRQLQEDSLRLVVPLDTSDIE